MQSDDNLSEHDDVFVDGRVMKEHVSDEKYNLCRNFS